MKERFHFYVFNDMLLFAIANGAVEEAVAVIVIQQDLLQYGIKDTQGVTWIC